MSGPSHLQQACEILSRSHDILAERVDGARAPGWCRARGWEGFLAELSDRDLARCETEGLVRHAETLGAPADLAWLARAVCGTTARFETAPPLPAAPAIRGASPRKRSQIAALVRLCAQKRRRWRRVVDVGAGRGHLTRELTRVLGVRALGLELDPARARRAEALTGAESPRFLACDAGADLRFREGDLAIGIHACGQLGDALVVPAARDGVDLLLVDCCL